MCCLQLCTSHYLERDENNLEVMKKVQQTLSSLVTQMIASELDDFELNRSSDFSTSSVGKKNRLFAQLAMGVYEVSKLVRVLHVVYVSLEMSIIL